MRQDLLLFDKHADDKIVAVAKSSEYPLYYFSTLILAWPPSTLGPLLTCSFIEVSMPLAPFLLG